MAKGETLLDKVTAGAHLSMMQKFLCRDTFTDEKNLENKAILIAHFEDREGFDAAKMAAGEPQTSDFQIGADVELEVLDFIAKKIDPIFEELTYAEDDYRAKLAVFRQFENFEMGHFYEWQKVDNPLQTGRPVAEIDEKTTEDLSL